MYEVRINPNKNFPYPPLFRLENAKINFPDFSGTRFGKGGTPNFHLVLEDPELVEYLMKSGCRVRTNEGFTTRSGEPYKPSVKVSIEYREWKAPLVQVVNNGRLVEYDQAHLHQIDDIKNRIDHVDVMVGGYTSAFNGQMFNKLTVERICIILRNNAYDDRVREMTDGWNNTYSGYARYQGDGEPLPFE